jgi:HlyD family secretion protein
MRKWWWVVLGIVSLGAVAFALTRSQPVPSVLVSTAKSQAGAFTRELRVTGNIEAQVYTLSFNRAGRVAKVLVIEGQTVKARQILAILETEDDTNKLALAQDALVALESKRVSQVIDAQNAERKLRGQLLEAQRKLVLQQKLLAVGSAAKFDVLEAERNVSDLNGQLETAIAQARNNARDIVSQRVSRLNDLRTAKQAIERAVLKAPVAGRVIRVDYLVGVDASLNPSKAGSVGTDASSSIKVLEAGTLRAKVKLPEAEALKVKIGQPVTVMLDADPNTKLSAKVERLGVQAEVAGQGGSATLPVTLRFLGKLETLKPGLTLSADITTLRLENTVRIPLEALLEEKGATAVWVLQKNAEITTVKRVAVKVLARNLTQAAITGLEGNAEVVVLPPPELKDGSSISLAVTP